MIRLPVTVPLGDRESATSAASRLARGNGRDRVRDFYLDLGLRFQGVVDGTPDALENLAALGGFNDEPLKGWSLRRIPEGYDLRGQQLRKPSLRRETVMGCPHCVESDMARDDVDLPIRPFGRALWQIASVRTCSTHSVALVEVAKAMDRDLTHDFAALIEPHLGDILSCQYEVTHRAPTQFEHYVEARIESGIGNGAWLDSFPLYAAMRLCEVIGAVAERGPEFKLNSLTETDLWRVAETGHEIVLTGEEGIRQFLFGLQHRFLRGRGDWGPRTMLGPLYEWLAHSTEDPVYEPVREIIANHVIETMPIGPGEEVFGGEVRSRRLHSVQSAAHEYKLHPKRLRKMLHAAGILRDEDMELTNERVVFPAEAAATFLTRAATALSLSEAEKYLNTPRLGVKLLVDAGFLQPFVTGGNQRFKNYAIAREDLDSFLSRLLGNATDTREGLANIPTAAKRANCSTTEVVGLLLDRKLSRVGHNPAVRGYRSVLVDPEEVGPLVRRQNHGGVSLRQVEKRMSWSTAVVKGLLAAELLPSRTAVNPINRCPQRVVDATDLRSFDAQFVSLHALAKERRIHHLVLKRELTKAGVRADPRFEGIPATFYARAHIEQALPA